MRKKFRIIKFKKSKPILQVKNVSKSFDGRPILKKINLDVHAGEICGLIGPNGSGKSTLYGAIIGQYKVDNGAIILNQKDITSIPIHERAKLGIAYLSQYRSVFNMTTFDNLLAICQISIKGTDKQRLMVEKLLTEFNLQHLRNIDANSLSGGEVRRLQIARTLINNPKVILLDEPMAALDENWGYSNRSQHSKFASNLR
jgi:lipopolysaccharide export system ATP-binding protein